MDHPIDDLRHSILDSKLSEKILELNSALQKQKDNHAKEIKTLKEKYYVLYRDLLWKYMKVDSYEKLNKYINTLIDNFGDDIDTNFILDYVREDIGENMDITTTLRYDIIMNYDKDVTHNKKIYEAMFANKGIKTRWFTVINNIMSTFYGVFIADKYDSYIMLFRRKLINLYLKGESLALEYILIMKNYALSVVCEEIHKTERYNKKNGIYNMVIIPQFNDSKYREIKDMSHELKTHFNDIKDRYLKTINNETPRKVILTTMGYVELHARYPLGTYIIKTNSEIANLLLKFNECDSYKCVKISTIEILLSKIGLIKISDKNVYINDDFKHDDLYIIITKNMYNKHVKLTSKDAISSIEREEDRKYYVDSWLVRAIKHSRKWRTWDSLYKIYIEYVINEVSNKLSSTILSWKNKKFVFERLETLFLRGHIIRNDDNEYKYQP
jgi:hypothetical protein